MELPRNCYQQLVLINGWVINVNEPLPPQREDPNAQKVWLILYAAAERNVSLETNDEGESVGESHWEEPARYFLIMRKADGQLPADVIVHEIEPEKVMIASRSWSQESALEEFNALFNEGLKDGESASIKDTLKSAGSHPLQPPVQATAAAAP